MITDAFDKSEVVFGPKDFYGEQKHLCDKCINEDCRVFKS